MERNPTARAGARSALFLCVFLCVEALLWSVATDACARTEEAAFSLEVGAREWRGARIRRIPAGATLEVEAQVSGPVRVLLLLSAPGEEEPDPGRDPLFDARTTARLSFSVKAPRPGDYYVVVDNRGGSSARQARITVRGTTPEPSLPEEASGEAGDARAKPGLQRASSELGELERNLHALFEFERFAIHVRPCRSGTSAFARSGEVVLCEAYVRHLRVSLADREDVQNVLLFTLFHEIGHVLLAQWDYPTYRSEETADEFAAALLVMLGQSERLDAIAEFFRTRASAAEVLRKWARDDPHPLSAQRARNVQRWQQSPDLARRWQSVFVPRMRREVLERLGRAPQAWTDPELIAAELAQRD